MDLPSSAVFTLRLLASMLLLGLGQACCHCPGLCLIAFVETVSFFPFRFSFRAVVIGDEW